MVVSLPPSSRYCVATDTCKKWWTQLFSSGLPVRESDVACAAGREGEVGLHITPISLGFVVVMHWMVGIRLKKKETNWAAAGIFENIWVFFPWTFMNNSWWSYMFPCRFYIRIVGNVSHDCWENYIVFWALLYTHVLGKHLWKPWKKWQSNTASPSREVNDQNHYISGLLYLGFALSVGLFSGRCTAWGINVRCCPPEMFLGL